MVGKVARPTTVACWGAPPPPSVTVSPMPLSIWVAVAVPSTISSARWIGRPRMIGGTTSLPGSMPSSGTSCPSIESEPK